MNDPESDGAVPLPAAPPAPPAPAPPAPAANPFATAPLADPLYPSHPGDNSDAADAAKKPILADKYELVRELARGAMGRVYLATQLGLNRKVAIKVMSPKLDDPDFRRRFMLEATGLANLNHRNIVTVYDFGESRRGMLYMVLEYLEGKTLAQVLKSDGTLPVARVISIATQLLRGLRAAHKKGIIHRDLKPSNVFSVKNEEGEEEIKILDFGVAKLFAVSPEQAEPDGTRDGILLGTPAFMSPEQIDGTRIGPQSDLYAVGCVVFNLLAGRVPFPGKNDVETLHGHLKVPPPLLRSLPGCEQLPPQVESFVDRLLQKDPDARFADADAAVEALRGITAELLATDAQFRAQITPDLAASMGSTGGNSGGSSFGRPTDSRPSGPNPAADTGDLRRVADNSSTGSMPTPAHVAAPAPPPRRVSPTMLGLGAAVVLIAIAVPFVLTRPRAVTIESVPAGLELIDESGAALGKSPVVVDVDVDVLGVRARVGDALSDVRRIELKGDRVVVDLRDWAQALAAPPAAPPPPATAPPATQPPVVERVPEPVGAPVQSRSSRPRVVVRSAPPPPPPSPPPQPAQPTSTAPNIGLVDEGAKKPSIGLVDEGKKKPDIGLLDERPSIAPID